MAELLKTFLLIVGVRETVVCAAIILLLGTARYFSSLPNLSGIPWVGKTPGWFLKGEAKRHFIANGASIIDEGYAKCKDFAFRLQTADMDRVVLSPKYVNEINRKVPEGTLSIQEAMHERLITRQTKLEKVFASSLHIDVCKVQLTQSLHALIGPLNEEVSYWLAKDIPEKDGAVDLNAYHTVLSAIVGSASRSFVGLPISRDPEWLKTAVGYTMDVFGVAVSLRPYPAFLRPLVARLMAGTKRLDDHLNTAKRCFSPIFAERLALKDSGAVPAEKPVDMIQWMVDSARGADRDPDFLSHNILFMTVVAVHTSAISAVHVLFDLCEMPEYVQPLREEVLRVVGEHGWTLPAINQMKLLDSFMKESQRMSPPGLLSFNRKVMKPLTLSGGLSLPAGAFITMPSSGIAHDPEIHPEPQTFDGFRFYKKRMASKEDANRHQFASTGPDSMAFGHGKLACPGRFFTAAQDKIVLANILLRYNVKFPGDQKERLPNVFSGEHVGPNRAQRVVFEPREDLDDATRRLLSPSTV